MLPDCEFEMVVETTGLETAPCCAGMAMAQVLLPAALALTQESSSLLPVTLAGVQRL